MVDIDQHAKPSYHVTRGMQIGLFLGVLHIISLGTTLQVQYKY